MALNRLQSNKCYYIIHRFKRSFLKFWLDDCKNRWFPIEIQTFIEKTASFSFTKIYSVLCTCYSLVTYCLHTIQVFFLNQNICLHNDQSRPLLLQEWAQRSCWRWESFVSLSKEYWWRRRKGNGDGKEKEEKETPPK